MVGISKSQSFSQKTGVKNPSYIFVVFQTKLVDSGIPLSQILESNPQLNNRQRL